MTLLGYIDGMSLYGYVRGNPFSMVDPTELAGSPILDAANSVKQTISAVAEAALTIADATGQNSTYQTVNTYAAENMLHRGIDAVAGTADLIHGAHELMHGNPADTVVAQLGGQVADRGVGPVLSDMGNTVKQQVVDTYEGVMSDDLETIGNVSFALGEVIMPGVTLKKTTDVIAATGKTVRNAIPSRVVIGETMDRVKDAAERYGADTYQPSNWYQSDTNPTGDLINNLKGNERWMDDLLDNKSEIYNIGEDAQRVRPSVYYCMEKEMLKESGRMQE